MKKRKLFVIFGIIFTLFVLAACGKKTDPTVDPTEEVTGVRVVFKYNDGVTADKTVTLEQKGNKVDKPKDPTRERFEFDGWFDGEDEFDFNTPINSNTILNARWTQTDAIVEFIGEDGQLLSTKEVAIGEKVVKPSNPVHSSGAAFDGWYLDNEPFDFNSAVEGDLRLVAKWEIAEEIDPEDVELVVPHILTYYIDTEFDIDGEIYAYNIKTGEPLEVEIVDQFYYLEYPSEEYYINYRVKESPTVTAKLNLVFRESPSVIPTALTKDPITIKFAHSNGSAIENAIKGYATEFENMMRDLGYDVTVIVDKPASTYDDLRTYIVNAIKGSELPNLVQNYPDHVVEYNNNGVIMPLTPYIFHPVHGMGEAADESIYDILEAYRAENRSNNLRGDYLSLPFNKSTEVATYNKTFFDAVLGRRDMPETWQDLFALIDDILDNKEEQIDAIAERWVVAGKPLSSSDIQQAKDQFVPFTYDSSANGFITLTRQFGGKYTSKDPVTGKGQVEFINANTINMLTYFASNSDAFTVPQYWGVDYANSVSFKGTTIFSVGSTGGARYNTPVENGVELYEIGMMPVPYDKFNPHLRTAIQQGTNISLTTQGTPDEKLASWLFLKYLTSKDVQADFAIKTGYFPVRNSSYSTPAYVAYLAEADVVMPKSAQEAGDSVTEYQNKYENKVKAMAAKAGSEQRQYWFYDEAFIGSSKAREEVGIAWDRIMLYTGGNLEAEINNALQNAREETEKIIK